jgi:hypothetical protein
LQHFCVFEHHLGPQQTLSFGAQCLSEMLPGQHFWRFGLQQSPPHTRVLPRLQAHVPLSSQVWVSEWQHAWPQHLNPGFHSSPPSGTQRWKLVPARAALATIPGTVTLTSAPPSSRSARRRGIGFARDRANSSRNAVTPLRSSLRRSCHLAHVA